MAFQVDTSPLLRTQQRTGQMLSGIGGVVGQGIRQNIDERRASERKEELAGLGALALSGDVAAQQQLATEEPEYNKQIFEQQGIFDEREQKAMIADTAQALSLHQASQPQQVVNFLDRRIEFLESQGRDATDTREIRDIYAQNPEQGGQLLASGLRAMTDPKAFAEGFGKTEGGGVDVKASEILEDGTLIQSTPQGPVVYDPTGKRVTGQAAADAITQARAQKVSNLRAAAGEKRRASLEAEEELKGKVEAGVINQKEAAKISNKAFNRLEGINQNISNLKEGIELVRSGANTGVIAKRLPSIKANAIKLDNLQGRLGLDVIQNTTFGALSESELKFALDTALPKGLEGEELVNWLQRKVDAQESLADYLEASAIFLGTPGNTAADWIKKQKEKQQTGGATVVRSQQEYDELPSGALFIEDGVQYRKP